MADLPDSAEYLALAELRSQIEATPIYIAALQKSRAIVPHYTAAERASRERMSELRTDMSRLEEEHTRRVLVALAKGKAAAVAPVVATREVLPNDNLRLLGFKKKDGTENLACKRTWENADDAHSDMFKARQLIKFTVDKLEAPDPTDLEGRESYDKLEEAVKVLESGEAKQLVHAKHVGIAFAHSWTVVDDFKGTDLVSTPEEEKRLNKIVKARAPAVAKPAKPPKAPKGRGYGGFVPQQQVYVQHPHPPPGFPPGLGAAQGRQGMRPRVCHRCQSPDHMIAQCPVRAQS